MAGTLNNDYLQRIADSVDPGGGADGRQYNNDYLKRIAEAMEGDGGGEGGIRGLLGEVHAAAEAARQAAEEARGAVDPELALYLAWETDDDGDDVPVMIDATEE